jgi:hypothetical protein
MPHFEQMLFSLPVTSGCMGQEYNFVFSELFDSVSAVFFLQEIKETRAIINTNVMLFFMMFIFLDEIFYFLRSGLSYWQQPGN